MSEIQIQSIDVYPEYTSVNVLVFNTTSQTQNFEIAVNASGKGIPYQEVRGETTVPGNSQVQENIEFRSNPEELLSATAVITALTLSPVVTQDQEFITEEHIVPTGGGGGFFGGLADNPVVLIGGTIIAERIIRQQLD